MSSERRIQCPSCAREIRLTEAELADKRGFCALCDARFDILPDMLVGSGPMRALAVPRVALHLNQPPGGNLVRVASGRETDLIHFPPTPGGRIVAVLGGLGALFAGLALLSPVMWGFIAGLGVAALAWLIWSLFARERLVVGSDGLLHTRGFGPLRRETRLAPSRLLSVETLSQPVPGHYTNQGFRHQVSIRGEDGEIVFGKLFGLDEQQADWFALAVRKALADAKGEG